MMSVEVNWASCCVFGANGQDGSYLCELLLAKGYRVIAIVRRSSTNNLKWIQDIKSDMFEIVHGDVTDASFVSKIIKQEQFDYCYNLSAMSHVGISFDIPQYTFQVNTIGVLNILEAIRQFSPKTRLYQASTSEMLAPEVGIEGYVKQVYGSTEKTRFEVHSPYACSKLAAHELCKIYRQAYGLFICCGILFNHESERRGDNFVTQKIVKNLVKMKKGLIQKFELGNIDACRDWGHAKDYVEAMYLMLQQDKPDDYVIATNESHSVKEFIKECCNVLFGKRWHLKEERDQLTILQNIDCDVQGFYESKEIGKIILNVHQLRPWDVQYLRGDPSKAKRVLGWEPKVKFKELVKIMISEELKKYE